MKYLKKFEPFGILIKESFVDINLIKELIDDYFLEYIQDSDEESDLRLNYYVNPNEINQEEYMSRRSRANIGDIPTYDYELKFETAIPIDKLKNIKRRLNSDSQLHLINFRANSTFQVKNDSTSEYTKINLSIVYLENKPIVKPDIVDKLEPILKEMDYKLDEKESGYWYLYRRRDGYTLSESDGITQDMFLSRKLSGSHIPKANKVEELKSKTLELYKEELDKEYKILKSIIPNLPEPTIQRVSTDDGFQIYLQSRSGKIEWVIYLQIFKPSLDKQDLNVISTLSYYDPIKTYSSQIDQ